MTLLQVDDLKVHFSQKKHFFQKDNEVVKAVDGVTFSIEQGQSFALVGESGSGKTTTALAVMQLVQITSGMVRLNDTILNQLDDQKLRASRKDYQMIFQDAYASLNPRFRIANIVQEPLDTFNIGSKQERKERVNELFAQVGLSQEQKELFPHQFSGGQRQRIDIARAIASNPKLVVCDEPVSALDVAIQAQILNLLRNLQEKLDLTYLFISHDLAVVQYIADYIAVMYKGKIVEVTDRITLFKTPEHPYTKALLEAVPKIDFTKKKRNRSIPHDIDHTQIIAGCQYAAICPHATDQCFNEEPLLKSISTKQKVACHLF